MDEDLQILKEACLALARLDADRLEDLAATCRFLNRDLSPSRLQGRDVPVQRGDCAKQLKVLGRIVEKTRENLAVIHRLQARSHRADGFSGISQPGLR